MTTKKFAQMRTKSLKALLETASEEDKVAIEAVLAAREQAQAPAAPAAPVETPAFEEETPAFEEETPLTPEEEAALKAAEENCGVNPTYTGRTAERKPKVSDEERRALAEKLKAEVVNHRCQAVPFNTVEWVDGYIAGVIEEKRSNKVLLAIKTDDGRRIVKVHDSDLVRVLDETIEPEKKTRAGRKPKDASEKIEWTPEAIADEVNKVIGNVGKGVAFEKYCTTDENGEEHIEMISGRIVAIVPDKRAQHLLYRISVPAPIEGNPFATKIMHKVVTTEGLLIAGEFDAEGAQLNAKYLERREAAATRALLTPQDRVIRCEENLKKAEEKLQKAQEELEAKKKQLEDAKKELDKYLAGQANGETAEAPAETTAEEESLA
jgi:hypothetical protein|nr:MAG TPA: hypothetical protein [Caudoviricetes sp.]